MSNQIKSRCINCGARPEDINITVWTYCVYPIRHEFIPDAWEEEQRYQL